MSFALPLAKQTSSGLDALGLCSRVRLSAFNVGRDLPEAPVSAGAEPAEGLFLQPISENSNQQFPPNADRNAF
ncbi:MAG TPA: hypothetical protein VHN11_13545, partial [Xanthobacteraceae bacterium]|nr:hypothetical protein [Xanthobacteraceae bacterium]